MGYGCLHFGMNESFRVQDFRNFGNFGSLRADSLIPQHPKKFK